VFPKSQYYPPKIIFLIRSFGLAIEISSLNLLK
jgi:hypothetical protein